jgi:hypothetical protein
MKLHKLCRIYLKQDLGQNVIPVVRNFFSFGSTVQFRPWPPPWNFSVSLQLLDLGQSVGPLGRVISSSQGLYLYTNTEKSTHNTNTKHPCPSWIRTHGPGVRVSEDSSCLRSLSYRDRPVVRNSKRILHSYKRNVSSVNGDASHRRE